MNERGAQEVVPTPDGGQTTYINEIHASKHYSHKWEKKKKIQNTKYKRNVTTIMCPKCTKNESYFCVHFPPNDNNPRRAI